VVAADVAEEALAETVSGIASGGGSAQAVQLDVANTDVCRSVVADIGREHGGLDILCNVAGVMHWGWVGDVTEADFDRLVGINLRGLYFLTQAALPSLLERKGVVVNMASAAGVKGQAYTSTYCITKAGVISFTKCLAVEYAKQGLRAVAVAPGGVNTALAAETKLPEGADMQLFQKLMPLMKVAEPDEIAGAVAYLASSEARYVNGATLHIDGAQTAG
jgi:meso-butanediol dehydrogenase/(S,S)-butanediol dehydrogenase/diacetyl reductase